jgi:hypothetical protein
MKIAKVVLNIILMILAISFLAARQEKIRASVGSRDSIQSWATGKLLIHRQNPYSVQDVETLERSAGYTSSRPLMYRCPPWALWLVVLPGLFSPYWAWVVWLAILFASLVSAMRLSWTLYGDGPRPHAVFLITGYLFAPVAACLVAGQVGLLLLLGIVLFLAQIEDHPFLAGMALMLPMTKPHIFALLWPVLAIWAANRRKWSIVSGFGTAFAIASALAFAFDPSVVQDYRGMLHQQAIQNEFIPALSGMIRGVFFRQYFFVQFVPLILGLIWTAHYYWTNRTRWNWRSHGLALLVVAVVTTPYAWMTDEVVLLPAILQGMLWLRRARLNVKAQLAILLFVCLDLLLLLIVKAQVAPATGIYFWSSLVWFSWYCFARIVAGTVSQPSTSQPQLAVH